jgi:pantetheine-phosphate adenylyltransferase
MTGKRIAVYPGSFDPLHKGHVDIIERCRSIFDEVVVAVLSNDEKRPLFSVEERMEMIGEVVAAFPDCRVTSFSGLLVDFVSSMPGAVIIRGLRAVSDFDYEFQMALMNRRLDPRVETVFLTPKEECSFLSSRLVKEVFFLGGNLEGLVPAGVLRRLAAARAAGR